MLKPTKQTKPVSTKSDPKSNDKKKKIATTKTTVVVDKKPVAKKPDVGSSTNKLLSSKQTIKSRGPTSITKSTQDKHAAISKKNVMNTIHNVTVSSPPTSAGKERSTSLVNIREHAGSEEFSQKQLNHSRTRTRTIAPEESILYQKKLMSSKSTDEYKPTSERKNPVAYEINFDAEKKSKKAKETTVKEKQAVIRQKTLSSENILTKQISQDTSTNISKIQEPATEENDEDYYESDFESYESDFEDEPSGESFDKSSSENDSSSEDIQDHQNNTALSEKVNADRVDSGSFDMSAKKSATISLNQYDSIDDTVNSHDSGILYDDTQAVNKRLLSPNVAAFYKRGAELMKKIAFDTVDFDVLEQKPIPYEVFMSVYGQRGMMQASTQSEYFTASEASQTDVVKLVNSWTQFPSKFTRIGLENVNSKLYNEEKHGVGEENFEHEVLDKNESIENIDMSIEKINNFTNDFHFLEGTQNLSDCAQDLRIFVQNASMSILNVLEGNSSKKRELIVSKNPVSCGYFEMKFEDVKILKDTLISKIWSCTSVANYLFTIHRAISSSQNFMCIWNIVHTQRPLRIFTAWSEIKCIEIHPEQRDLIIGGCTDGTICLWNIQENSDTNEAIQPCEIISLNQNQNDFALDNVAALKSLAHRVIKNKNSMFEQSLSSQFCSLHENGVLSVWTLLQVDSLNIDLRPHEMDFIWNESKVKLIKNTSIDLNKFLKNEINEETPKSGRKKSAFDKTRYYFENDLFSDKILKELQEIDIERIQRSKNLMYRNEIFRAVSFDLNFNELFIASDTNYIVAMSRLCLGDKVRKIITNESNFISPSVIKTHPIDANILAIGQTNGNIKFIKTCDDLIGNGAKKRKQLRRSNAAFSNDENVLAKSCAFQNIVEREKKLYDETQALNNLASDELKVFLFNESLLSNRTAENEESYKNNMKIVFDKNVFNSFDVCMGSVRLIEFSKTGQFMFALLNKDLKIFDCWKNVEIQNNDNRAITDVKCISVSDGNEYMVLLTSKMEVIVNKLKF